MTEGTPRSLRKILVVEDSRTQAEYLRHILENEGYRVTLAGNGSEALEQVAIDPPSLIFTDVVMPEMDGYEFCRRVKADTKTASIPVILVTQLFDPVDVIRGLECGADDFVIKPFEAGYLKSRISTILSSDRESDEEPVLSPLPVTVGGTTYQISAGRRRIFNILLSTYEVAVSKNAELLETQDRLAATNDQLQDAVLSLNQTNEQLAQENAGRRRVQKALDEANTKLNLMASITRHDVINQLTSQHESLDSALSLRDRDSKKAWEHVATAAEIATQTLSSVRFTSEYQKVGVKAPQWHNLAALVNAAIQRSLFGPVKIENALPADREIYADPLIGMVFANLIDNALRYGMRLTCIRFSLEEHNGSAIVVCEDDGIGVPAAKKDKIFTYEYGMDTGLGLFLSREILAITGITISETGSEGKGARFEMACPGGIVRKAPPQSL